MNGGMMGGMMLNGRDTTRAEVEEMRAMFMRHPDITRSVTNLPDGIETLTESTDPDLTAAIVGHVVKMVERMEDGRDPMVPIQSPTLQILFERGDSITTKMMPTDTGIRVTQTSSRPGGRHRPSDPRRRGVGPCRARHGRGARQHDGAAHGWPWHGHGHGHGRHDARHVQRQLKSRPSNKADGRKRRQRMMNGHGMGMGMGMGFGWIGMILFLVLIGLVIAALIKYLRS